MKQVQGRAIITTILALTMLLMALPASANAAYESASTETWPWSGYWWPAYEDYKNLYDTNQALDQYDEYIEATTGTAGKAQAWEKQNRSTTDPDSTWWGYCHAWATSAILNKQPPSSVTKSGVSFDKNDTRGLATVLYYEPTYHWLSGTRSSSDNVNDAAYKDISPAWMDYLLRYYVGYYRYPFIMDLNADSQVWNYPIFAYRRTTTPQADGSERVKTRVWYTSPKYDATGTWYKYKDYTYTLRQGTLGTWTGDSVAAHPDFAWLPTGKKKGTKTNPHVNEATVESILGRTLK